jgi:RHS repeat-associated protein
MTTSATISFSQSGMTGSATVFGPQMFVRSSGKPVTEQSAFSNPVGGSGFTLKVQNGDYEGNHRVTSATITLNGSEVLVPSDFNQHVPAFERPVTLQQRNILTVQLQGKPGSFLVITIDGGPVNVNAPHVAGLSREAAESALVSEGLAIGTISSQFSSTVPAGNVISQDPSGGTSLPQGTPVNLVVSLGIESVMVPNVIGMTLASAESVVTSASLTIGAITSISDNSTPAGQVVSQSPSTGTSVPIGTAVSLVVSLGPATTMVPNVTGLNQTDAEAAIFAGNLTVGSVTTSYSNTIASGTVISQNPTAGSTVQQGSVVSLVVSLGDGPETIPPDPETIAPPVDGTVATTVAASTEFLYTGANPIQTGVAPGTIEVRRAAVLRGLVSGSDGNPLSGVIITILNHPEFGQTMTRADGMFDMAVNGGGYLTVNYRKEGYMPVQRQVDTPWNDFAWLSDVVMLPFDNQVTTINLASSAPIQVARGSVSTDADGTRQATMFFSQGTTAQMVMPDGTTQPLTSLNVRATEYTVGPNGPKAMPADLPPTSAYTYAVELSADEAIAAGATEVRFDKPVYFYVENFLNFPVGGIVPTGYYDYQKTAWIPSDNGRIIKMLSMGGGLAELDTDGSGQAADANKLAALGITDVERQQLASLYAPGQSLWRVPVTHFTPWDCNWPYGPPPGAKSPEQPEPEFKPIDDPCEIGGSIIECQNQVLGERISIPGTSFTLNYRSSRVPGHKAAYTLNIPLSGATVPADLKRIDLVIDVAGRRFSQSFSASSNQSYTFRWDGKDAYGRTMQGKQPLTARIGYVYELVYLQPSDFADSFGRFSNSGVPLTGNRADREVILWQIEKLLIGSLVFDARTQGLGGWDLDIHHVYDPVGKVLLLGNGSRRSADLLGATYITTVAGNGNYGYGGDGGPATSAILDMDTFVAVGPDGSIYISDMANDRIRRVGLDGIITTVAGNGNYGYGGDGGPATSASLAITAGAAFGSDGSFYFADKGSNRIRRVGLDGIITTVAGNGNSGYGGDGGPATSTPLELSVNVAVGPDGSIYFSGAYRIHRVGPDGIITTVAGNGKQGYFGQGDGGPATSASLSYNVTDVAVGPDGSIYIADGGHHCIRRVGPDGIITTVAGGRSYNTGSDGGPATNVKLGEPHGVTLGSDGSIYIADSRNHRIRRVGLDGIITTVAGNGNPGYGGDGGPATSASFNWPTDVAVGPDGSIYIADRSRIRRVASCWPSVSITEIPIPSEDGREVYIFNGSGKHLRTLNTLTGATLFSFGYDSFGRLSTVTDGSGNISTIERDPSGNLAAIVAPFGQRTTITVDANGYLSNITNPAGETYQMTYTSDGLLTTFIEPKGNASQFTYDEQGLLTRDENAVGGFSSLFSTHSRTNSIVSLGTALGRSTTYLTENLYNGQRRTVTGPTGATSVSFMGDDGVTRNSSPDGTSTIVTRTPDPRFGMQAPLESITIKLPSGKNAAFTKVRTVSLANPNNYLSLTSQTDLITFNGRNYSSVYSAATRLLTTTSPAGRQNLTLLDNLGRTLSFTPDPTLIPVAFNYDARGRLSLISQGNIKSTYVYDALGRVASINDAVGNFVRYGYDLADRVTRLTLPSGRSYNFSYDANGNTTQITMPSGAVHGLGYTVINQAKNYTPPANPAYAWNYNLDQDWTGALLPGGRRIDAGYDGGGRSTALVYPEAAIGYHYDDATNRIKRIVRTEGSVALQNLSFTYDGALVTGESFVGVANGNFTFTYDNNFFLTQMQLASGSDSVITPLTRDPDGLVTGFGPFTLTRQGPTGAVSQISDPGLNIAVTYDTLGRIASRTHTVNGRTVYAIQLSYDSRGNISKKTESVSGVPTIFEYAYDQDGQLVQVKKNGAAAEIFAYDVNGNRTTYDRPGEWKVVAEFDGQDRIIGQGGNTYQFNADGQLSQRNTDTYWYSATGELLQAKVAGETIIYSYDGTGRRIARTTGTGTRQYLYGNLNNPFQLTAQRDTTGVLSYYYYDENGLLFAFDKGAERYYVATDQVGTPMVVADATGNVVKQMEYDSFGKASFDSNPGFEIPVGFAGGISDSKTGLVRFGYRDYEPIIGRWTAKDPIFFAGGLGNLFGYVANNPVNWVDPSGRELIGAGIGALVGGVGGGIIGAANGTGFWRGALSGGVGGFLTGLTFNPALGATGSGLVAGMIAGATGGLASGIVAETFDAVDPCNNFSMGDVVQSTAMGAAFGGLLGPLGKLNTSSVATPSSQIAEGLLSGNVQIYSGIGAKR